MEEEDEEAMQELDAEDDAPVVKKRPASKVLKKPAAKATKTEAGVPLFAGFTSTHKSLDYSNNQ